MRNFIFNLKMRLQRFHKGYCSLDVWNIDGFIEEKLLAIFKEYKKRHCGHPFDVTKEEWEEIIDRIIFLLTEMNEDTCSLKTDDYAELGNYRSKCKDELYDLLKKWHWDLWD